MNTKNLNCIVDVQEPSPLHKVMSGVSQGSVLGPLLHLNILLLLLSTPPSPVLGDGPS